MAIYLSKGVTISVDETGGSSTWTKLAQVMSIDGASSSVDSVETTNLDSAEREYRPGLPKGGEVGFDLEFDPADTGHVFVRGLASTPQILSWQISYPTDTHATLDTFTAFLTEFSPKSGAPGDKIEASVKLQVTGPVVTTTAP